MAAHEVHRIIEVKTAKEPKDFKDIVYWRSYNLRIFYIMYVLIMIRSSLTLPVVGVCFFNNDNPGIYQP